jgi:hypothetical protein
MARQQALALYNAVLTTAQSRFLAWFDFDEWLYVNKHRYLTRSHRPMTF